MTDRGSRTGGAGDRPLSDERLEALLSADALTTLERTTIREGVVRAVDRRVRRRRRLFHLSLIPAAAAGLVLGVILMRAFLPGPASDPSTRSAQAPVAVKGRAGPEAKPVAPRSPHRTKPVEANGARSVRGEPTIDRLPPPAFPVATGARFPVVQGTVLDADGLPASDALVRGVSGLEGNLAQVDPTGHFFLRVRPASIRSSFFHVAPPRGRGLRGILFRYAPGTPVQLTFHRGQPVRGVIQEGESNRPLGEAVVALTVFVDDQPLYREAVASSHSGFTLQPIPAIHDSEGADSAERSFLQLDVYRRGYVRRMMQFRTAAELERSLERPLRLAPAGRMVVEITTPEGQPLPGTVVRLEPATPRSELFTYRAPAGPMAGPRGRVRFENVPCGPVRVHAAHPDAQPAPAPQVTVTARETTRCPIVLTPGRQIGGRVVDPSGQPIPGAMLFALRGRESGRESDRPPLAHGPVFTDAEGRFLFTGLVPGTYGLHAYYVPVVGREATAVVRPGQPTGRRNVSITLSLSAVDLVLEVRDARTGRAVADGSVILLGPSGRAFRRPERTPDGRLMIRGVDPSRTAIQVLAPGYLPSALRRVLLPAGRGEVTVGVALYRPSTLSGVVVDRSGRPVPGATVVAGRDEVEPIRPDHRSYHSAGFLRTATTDANGRFTLAELRVKNPLGIAFELTVIRPGHEPHTVQGLTLLQGESLEGVRITVP